MSESTEGKTSAGVRVPMSDVVRFVGQLSHDLRNNLNAVELQSAFLNEVAEDAEVKGEVQRLRAMLSTMGSSLQRLTSLLATIKLTEMPYKAADFVEDLQSKIAAQFPEQSASIAWSVNVGDVSLLIDPQNLQQAFLELFANAFAHLRNPGEIVATATVADGNFTFTMQEPKKDFAGSTEDWGREPFKQVAHGHYGLGLYRTRAIIEAHHGSFSVRHDPAASSLVLTVVLPVAAHA
ncbi:MAG: HAMP domain-containing histidine kinase [Verrucomicrobiota bacterium]|nr:HAMP domain-containing histidine kinase [Verrucomicrobiota bacterium]